MPLYAHVAGELTRPGFPQPRRGTCPECSEAMIAKTGSVVVWHWAHVAHNPNCRYGPESEWHLEWKARALDGTQEWRSPDGRRRADVMSPAGFAVEFQRSALSPEEVEAREKDWGRQLVWVFDGSQAAAHENLITTGRYLLWLNCPVMVRMAVPRKGEAGSSCQVLVDLGDGRCWLAESYAPGARHRNAAAIFGFPVPVDAVVAHVLCAPTPAAMSLLRRYDPRPSRSQADPGRKLHLPWCAADHPRCVFTAGSLYCVNDPCGNPHHRYRTNETEGVS